MRKRIISYIEILKHTWTELTYLDDFSFMHYYDLSLILGFTIDKWSVSAYLNTQQARGMPWDPELGRIFSSI